MTTQSTHDTDFEQTREGFAVTTEALAAWAADKILTARERAVRIRHACQEQIADAEQEAARAEAFFLPHLQEWAAANPPAKGKTIKLPVGRLTFRSVPGGPRVTDPDAALLWAKVNLPDAVVVKETASVTALKAYVAATGDMPDGVEVIDDRDVFDVKA